MARIPNIFEQIFESGDDITGVAYTGTGSDSRNGLSNDGHVYRQFRDAGDGAIDGGLIDLAAHGADTSYRKVIGGYVYSDGATSIDLFLVDPDGFDFLVDSGTTDTLSMGLLEGYGMLPGWGIKVVVDNAVGAGGGKIILYTELWFNPAPFIQPQ